MTVRKFRFSNIEYRPDPSRPDASRIPLGVIIEGDFRGTWWVAFRVRTFLAAEERATLDGVAKELLGVPFDLVVREVQGVLPKARQPGDVLGLLASSKIWSFHVTAPKAIEIPVGSRTAREALETATLTLYGKCIGVAAAGKQRPLRRSPMPWARASSFSVPLSA